MDIYNVEPSKDDKGTNYRELKSVYINNLLFVASGVQVENKY